MIELIRMNEKTKRLLINIKRRTGIDNWNTICRWAFCISIRNADAIIENLIESKSNVEMTWKTFAGSNDRLYFALLKNDHATRIMDGEKITLSDLLICHIQRGVSIINSESGNSTASVLLGRVA